MDPEHAADKVKVGRQLATLSACTPLLILLFLGAATPFNTVMSIVLLATPVLGLIAGVWGLLLIRAAGTGGARTAAVAGITLNAVILCIFISNLLAWYGRR